MSASASVSKSDDRRVALITGCSSPNGLGTQTALQLVKRGYKVYATARKVTNMSHLQGKCELLKLDVTDSKSIQDVVRQVSDQNNGRLDLLINNAAITGPAPALDMSLDGFRQILETNLIAPLAVIQASSPLLVKAGNEPAPGSDGKIRKSVVVNMGSLVHWGPAWSSGYNASKAALETLSDTMRIEMANLNVKVVNCETGIVRTDVISHVFDITSTTPTPYYKNFKDIHSRVLQGVKDGAGLIISPEKFAKRFVNAIDRSNPNGKIWIGTMSSLFSWLMPFFETVGLKDWFWRSQNFTGMVEKPRIRSD
ncbi:uncharacterized protein IL334_005687 [Kwoniella shivajii]|uniref:NADPH-dependent 1-acyldihydroxyacetone phosphate reductase n=1 Tax=Kwoniella shivajii TaxID=564305 RepID=A0ABZ1D3U3_9TREE|nr:hypothetical protein IL334_005687 [Kwoniella shivajii]